MTTYISLVERPFFTEREAKYLLGRAMHFVVPLEGEQLLSSQDILDGVATALRQTFIGYANNSFDDVTVGAVS